MFSVALWILGIDNGDTESERVEMIDLTKIEKPFGLLDAETQKALIECGGPWEMYDDYGWEDNAAPAFSGGFTYRQKPQPREYEAWQVVYSNGEPSGLPYLTEFGAVMRAHELGGRAIRLTGVA
jgi:hypothetical protein